MNPEKRKPVRPSGRSAGTGPLDPDPNACPVCGWRPCTALCRLGLTEDDLAKLEAKAQTQRAEENAS
jgi:hypothetical protein